MTSRSAWLSWALVALLPLCAPAAPVAPDQVLRFERLGQDEGLSQGSITAIAQDSFGFVWIGTQDGLNRYDGNEIRIFRPDGSTGALEDSHVRCLLAGPEGALWVGTREGGLARWDPKNETFQTFRSDPNRPDSLSFDYVNSILANDDGTLWVGTLEGLNLFDPKTGKARRFLADKKDPRTLASNEISFLFRDESGLVWVVFKNGAIDTLDASHGICHRKPELAALGTIGNVNAAVNAGGGRVLLGTASGRLLEWTAAGGFTDTADRFVADRPITSLKVEGRALWIGTRGGLLRRDELPARLVTVKPDPADPHSLPSEMVQTLFEDRTGVLWVGTTVGVARLDPASTAFRVYRRSAGHDGPADAYVWAVTSDAAGNLWVGSDGGLSRLDRETGTWRSWAANPSDPGALASDSVTALLVDRAGTLWAGGNRGLSRYDAEADRFTSWLKGAGDPPLRNARVFDLLETKDGSLYVGTGSAAYHFAAGGAAFPRLGGEDLAPSVFAMAEDTDGAIWLGTFHNGLYRVDPKTHASSRLVDAGGRDLIEPQQISALLVDGKGRLWIGTAKGVFRRDPGAKAVKQYRMRDGLPNDVILGLVEDDEGAIWMSTNGGIAKHDPVAGTFRVYQARDGLPSNEFNQMAAGRTPQGEILFGTPSGMVAFHPGALTKDPRPPQVALTGFELFNAAVPIRPAGAKGEGFALASSILTTKSLVLSHREDVVTLTFAGLHFAAPEEVRYAYRLEGWDKDWNTASARRRSATYTNLPAGRYVFRVRAANKDGVWNEEGVSLALRVLPPPWKTWWAYTAYALLLFGGIAGFFTYRMNALRKRQRDLEALVDVRTKELAESEQRALSANQAKSVFLANMSHELRTPLNAVLGFAQLLDRSPALRGDDRSGLEIIRRSGEHLLGLINDVLSLSKIEAGKLSLEKKPFSLRQMVRGVDAMLRSRADEAGLRFVVDASDLPEAVNGDEGKLRQVLVNLLGNAVKFTRGVPNGSVTLRASWSEGRARFEVADTGHGIAAAELATLFSPFVQTESGRKSKEGTGLGLVITREIVRLMDGDLTVTSEPGRGSTFAFEVALPAGEAAPAKAVEGRVVGLAEGERARRVLVADDTPENRLLIVRLLTSVGLEVIEAVNGEEAVRLWEKERPDVVLMDMRMPVLDGREATRAIREKESRETRVSRTPIVALTASVFEHERDEILASGADDFLMKPFREPQLFRILEERTGVRFRMAGDGGAESVPTQARSPRELVAGLEAGEAARIRRSLEDGDLEAAARAAEEVGRRNAALGESLLAEIRAFRVDDLLSALEAGDA
ncbi:MAG: response regulator [Acidobacteria bacterium]|nr:response regulator [Acidobacteriota bacterium]